MTLHVLLRRLIREEDGQELIEYALLAVFIAILSVLVFPSIATKMGNAYSNWTRNGGSVQKIWVPNDPQ